MTDGSNKTQSCTRRATWLDRALISRFVLRLHVCALPTVRVEKWRQKAISPMSFQRKGQWTLRSACRAYELTQRYFFRVLELIRKLVIWDFSSLLTKHWLLRVQRSNEKITEENQKSLSETSPKRCCGCECDTVSSAIHLSLNTTVTLKRENCSLNVSSGIKKN